MTTILSDPCDQSSTSSCKNCTIIPDFQYRRCSAMCENSRCNRRIRNSSGQCDEHRSNQRDNVHISANYTEREVASQLVAYVFDHNIKAVLFDWDLTASSVHMGGYGGYTCDTMNNKENQKQKYIKEHADLLSISFRLSVNRLLAQGVKVGIATFSDARRNTSDDNMLPGHHIVFTGEPFIKLVLSHWFPTTDIPVYAYLGTNKIPHINEAMKDWQLEDYQTLLLVDDDRDNINSADILGVRTIWSTGSEGFGTLKALVPSIANTILVRSSIEDVATLSRFIFKECSFLDVLMVRKQSNHSIDVFSYETLKKLSSNAPMVHPSTRENIRYTKQILQLYTDARAQKLDVALCNVENQNFQLCLLTHCRSLYPNIQVQLLCKVYQSFSVLTAMGMLFDTSDDSRSALASVDNPKAFTLRLSLQSAPFDNSYVFTMDNKTYSERYLYLFGYGIVDYTTNVWTHGMPILFTTFGELLMHGGPANLIVPSESDLQGYLSVSGWENPLLFVQKYVEVKLLDDNIDSDIHEERKLDGFNSRLYNTSSSSSSSPSPSTMPAQNTTPIGYRRRQPTTLAATSVENLSFSSDIPDESSSAYNTTPIGYRRRQPTTLAATSVENLSFSSDIPDESSSAYTTTPIGYRRRQSTTLAAATVGTTMPSLENLSFSSDIPDESSSSSNNTLSRHQQRSRYRQRSMFLKRSIPDPPD